MRSKFVPLFSASRTLAARLKLTDVRRLEATVLLYQKDSLGCETSKHVLFLWRLNALSEQRKRVAMSMVYIVRNQVEDSNSS